MFNIAAAVYAAVLVNRVVRGQLTWAGGAAFASAGAALVLAGAWLSRRGARASGGAPVA